MQKLNCWEFMGCGREQGGRMANELGTCSAASHHPAHGINGGVNGGRVCWLIAGTYGRFRAEDANCISARRFSSCLDCVFHTTVLKEEGYILQDSLITKMMKKKFTFSGQ